MTSTKTQHIRPQSDDRHGDSGRGELGDFIGDVEEGGEGDQEHGKQMK